MQTKCYIDSHLIPRQPSQWSKFLLFSSSVHQLLLLTVTNLSVIKSVREELFIQLSYKKTSPGQVQLKPQHPGSRQMGYSILMDRNQKGVIRGATVRHNPQGHASFNPAPPTRPVAHSSPLHTFHSGFESILGLTQSLTESETLQPNHLWKHRSHTQVFLNHPAISNSPRYFLIQSS